MGVIKPSGVVFIKEAGPVCSRGVQPEVLGMKLHRKGEKGDLLRVVAINKIFTLFTCQ